MLSLKDAVIVRLITWRKVDSTTELLGITLKAITYWASPFLAADQTGNVICVALELC